MQKIARKLFPWRVQWKGVLLESLVFVAAYILWVAFRSPQSPSRLLIGSVSVLAPGITASILIIWFSPRISTYSQRPWRLLGIGLACWSAGEMIRTYYEAIRGIPSPIFSAADILNFLVYPLLFTTLVLFPFENRYAPSRFRFLLDVIISSGAAGTIGWLILGRSYASRGFAQQVPMVYPIADLILLMILVNVFLANRKARRTLSLWGTCLLLFLISDYIFSLLAPVNGYQVGGLESLGWTLGNLLFGFGAVYFSDLAVEGNNQEEDNDTDLGNRIQNILPITLVLVLVWFVLADWRLTGRFSIVGAGMALSLGLVLIVRLGVRAGEVELHKYWQLFSSIAEPTFLCDANGKILLVNPAFVRAAGLDRENQIIDQPLTKIFDASSFPADLFQRARQRECSQEVLLNPHQTPYLLSLSPIFPEGRKVLLAGAAHDLSDQKRQQVAIQNAYSQLQVVYRQLEELNTQLEQKVQERTSTLKEAYQKLEEQNKILQMVDQLKSDFVSMVSHELRTPLTSLNGGLELLLNQKGRPTSDRTTLSLMKHEVQRLTRFVENILNLSAMDAGRITLHLNPLCLSNVMETVCRQFSTVPGMKRVHVAIPEDLPEVVADETLLQSVFSHLLDNALKYALDGSVVVDVLRKKRRVRVRVTDSGPGIPEGKRALLFRRFQRLDVKDSQSVYGYGLGLYLSRRMLRAMQSDLKFESPPEGGARFYFDLKVVR